MARPTVISLVHPDNRLSQRVAERIGERRIGSAQVPGFEGTMQLWGIDAEAWQAPGR